MAKGKKDRKKDKPAKAVGGIKLPKKLRKAGSLAMDLAREPVVSEIVAGALLSAAAALRDNKRGLRAASAAGEEAIAAAGEAGKQATKMGDALRELAIDLARRTLDNWDRPGGGGGKSKAPGAGQKG